MLGTSARPETVPETLDLERQPAGLLSVASRFRLLGLVVLAALIAVAAWYAAQVIVLDHSASAAINANVAQATAPLRPDASLQITASGAGVELANAQLFRADVRDDGTRSAEQPVPVRLEPTAQDGAWQVVPADGASLLRPDGAYRLAVRVAAPRPALPMPRTDFLDKQYRFTTVPSPHARVPGNVLQPRWAESVSFTWSEPIQDVSLTIQPAVPLRSWVDPADRTRTWVQLGGDGGAGLTDGQTYTINIASAQATDGIALQQPASFKVAVPARPHFVDVPTEPVTLRYGDTFTLKSDRDLASAQVSTTPDVPTRVDVGRDQIHLALPEYQQGAEFDLDVAAAVSAQGAPLAQPLQVHFVTPPALDPPTFAPEDGSVGIQPSRHPSVTFAAPVADTDAATNALRIDPPVAGHWKWSSSADYVEFVPDSRLPILTRLTVTLRGGPDGPRTTDGGYLEEDQSATFRTTDIKKIDVSLGRQIMTLYENNVPVRTINVATGVAAAPTPTGTFYVQYKSSQMRFQGFNPDGSHYDIPDVHWVLPFWGDYTIHGAYWRPRFGVPGSDGCVSMSDPDAKLVYDWADVGTPVVIHS
jgi:lipoprotein-anchoring transpeptidase ErfK/SrfK